MKRSRYWFVAAGTGGHIFPGLTLADELKKKTPDADFLFFGTKDRLEARLVPANGYHIHFLSAKQFKGQGIFSKLFALLWLAIGFFQVLFKIFEGKPTCLISVGGYVSVPTALACLAARVPLFILEPNIRSGLANRFLSRFAKAAFCPPGADALKLFKCEVQELGNPVRANIEHCEIRDTVQKILVLGGSQGALSVCKLSLDAMSALKAQGHNIRLTLQSGDKNYEQSLEWVKENDVSDLVFVQTFITKMSDVLKAHDLVIARAGAMTIAELTIAGLPTVFIPYPFAADDHQRVNAKMLEESGAALVVDEKDPEALDNLLGAILSLSVAPNAKEKRLGLNQAFRKWARPKAGEEIAKQILSKLS